MSLRRLGCHLRSGHIPWKSCSGLIGAADEAGSPACGSVMPAIPFNMPYTTGEELACIQQAIERRHLSGDGHFTRLCQDLLAQRFGSASALLTVSCTAALEMSMLLLD